VDYIIYYNEKPNKNITYPPPQGGSHMDRLTVALGTITLVGEEIARLKIDYDRLELIPWERAALSAARANLKYMTHILDQVDAAATDTHTDY
jgi:hypothetical protein